MPRNYNMINSDPEALALIEKIRKEGGGVVRPRAVVDAARPEDSPLHKYFEWNDGSAADNWRTQQARELIVRIRVEVVRHPPTVLPSPPVVQAYQSRNGMRRNGGGYERIEDIFSDEAKRLDMLRTVIRELKAVKDRSAGLHELAGVWGELESVIARIEVVAA